MALDYNKVKSLSDDEFSNLKLDLDQIKVDPRYSKVQPETLEKVERFLDLKPGTLKDIEGYLKKENCPHCNREMTLLDKVVTALIDADHSKSFILHTMIGNKRTANPGSSVRCIECGTVKLSSDWHFWGAFYCSF